MELCIRQNGFWVWRDGPNIGMGRTDEQGVRDGGSTPVMEMLAHMLTKTERTCSEFCTAVQVQLKFHREILLLGVRVFQQKNMESHEKSMLWFGYFLFILKKYLPWLGGVQRPKWAFSCKSYLYPDLWSDSVNNFSPLYQLCPVTLYTAPYWSEPAYYDPVSPSGAVVGGWSVGLS